MLSLSKHSGQGLCARPFDKLRVTGPTTLIFQFRGYELLSAHLLPQASSLVARV